MKADKIPSKSTVSEFYDLEKRLTLTEEEFQNLDNLIQYDREQKKFYNQYDEVVPFTKIARNFKLNPQNLRYAIKKQGLSLKSALKKLLTKQKLTDLAEKYSIPYPALYARINYYGYTLEEALTLPLRSYRKGKKEGKNGK